MIVCARTDTGVSRTENQDAFSYYEDEVSLYLVADGMGGHRGGDFASNLVADLTIDLFKESLDSLKSGKLLIPKFINKAIEKANDEIFRLSKEDMEDGTMGTTIVMIIVKNNTAYIAHVGDSRAYLIRDKVLKQLTIDHSLVEALIESGSITKEEAKSHPQRNIITRAVGTSKDIEVEIDSIEIKKDDIILLSSDGFHGILNEDYIIDKINTTKDLTKVCEDFIDEVNHLGGPDNITILIMKKS
ncbi:MAG: Stp1/IreP family PP2C-type Ser/Thr phosphatase [Andreesenia angusta]|nr:Stp1/IreP family PP2C-type Ser/Thr phosphatase [Andreesenia angusta]